MFSSALAQKKAMLVARCEAERLEFAADAALFRHRARWIEWGWELSNTVLPHLKFLAPVMGFLAARNLPQGIRALSSLPSLWNAGRRILPVLSNLLHNLRNR